MTSLHIEESSFDREGWTRALSALQPLSLMQTWEFAEAKAATGPWNPVRVVIRDGDRVVGLCQGLSRRIAVAGGGLLWINRGPLMTADGPALRDVLPLIWKWAAVRKWYVRLAPPVAAGSLPDDDLRSSGFRYTDTPGWCSARVDLSLSEDSLRRGLDQKWRNCLNKAIRESLTVEVSACEDAFRAHLSDLGAMLHEKAFATSVTPALLTELQKRLPKERKMIVATAARDGRRIGSNLFALYGDTAEYLSGSVGAEGRPLNAGHFLLWSGLVAARAQGYRWFDLGGMHPERTPKGIFHFKEGLNGQAYCLEREIESARHDWRSALIRWRIGAARRLESATAE